MQLLRKREVTERLKKNASKIIVGAGIDSNPARLYFDSLWFLLQTMRRTILAKFKAEKEKLTPEKKALVMTHLPRFLSLLEEELYAERWLIWRFSHKPSLG